MNSEDKTEPVQIPVQVIQHPPVLNELKKEPTRRTSREQRSQPDIPDTAHTQREKGPLEAHSALSDPVQVICAG